MTLFERLNCSQYKEKLRSFDEAKTYIFAPDVRNLIMNTFFIFIIILCDERWTTILFYSFFVIPFLKLNVSSKQAIYAKRWLKNSAESKRINIKIYWQFNLPFQGKILHNTWKLNAGNEAGQNEIIYSIYTM